LTPKTTRLLRLPIATNSTDLGLAKPLDFVRFLKLIAVAEQVDLSYNIAYFFRFPFRVLKSLKMRSLFEPEPSAKAAPYRKKNTTAIEINARIVRSIQLTRAKPEVGGLYWKGQLDGNSF
jgi:hypothetical protein